MTAAIVARRDRATADLALLEQEAGALFLDGGEPDTAAIFAKRGELAVIGAAEAEASRRFRAAEEAEAAAAHAAICAKIAAEAAALLASLADVRERSGALAASLSDVQARAKSLRIKGANIGTYCDVLAPHGFPKALSRAIGCDLAPAAYGGRRFGYFELPVSLHANAWATVTDEIASAFAPYLEGAAAPCDDPPKGD